LKNIQQNALLSEKQKTTGIGDELPETQSNNDPDIVAIWFHNIMANVPCVIDSNMNKKELQAYNFKYRIILYINYKRISSLKYIILYSGVF